MRFLRADRAASETARLWRSRMRPQLLPDPARLLDLGSGVSDSHSPGGSSCGVALRRPDNIQADGRILFPDVHCPGLSLLICGISFPVARVVGRRFSWLAWGNESLSKWARPIYAPPVPMSRRKDCTEKRVRDCSVKSIPARAE